MKYLSALFLLSCVEFAPSFEREEFENQWWEIQAYPLCFNFHQSGHLFSYEEQTLEEGQWRQIFEEGEWVFHEPNEYSVLDTSIFVYENEECWDIEEYFDTKIITACECIILGE